MADTTKLSALIANTAKLINTHQQVSNELAQTATPPVPTNTAGSSQTVTPPPSGSPAVKTS